MKIYWLIVWFIIIIISLIGFGLFGQEKTTPDLRMATPTNP